MTSPLDDALDSASVVFDRPDLTVQWKELPAAEADGTENVFELSDVLTGEYVVQQSFDDALPDPVTMTGSNDASGKLEAALNGREAQMYNGWTLASISGENAFSSTFIGTTLPTFGWGNYMLMAIVVPSTTAVLTQGELEGTKYAWDFVAKQTSGTMALWLFSKRAYTGMAAPSFYSDVTVSNTVYACAALGASSPGGNELRWRVHKTVQSSAAGSATVHNQAAIQSTAKRTVFLGVWASPGPSSWSMGGGDTEIASWWNATSAVIMGRAGLYTGTVDRQMTATRAAATSDVAMITLAVEPFERPRMDTVQFWSPFNEDSPVYGLERDTPDVQLQTNVVTAEGVEPTVIFNGQMEDIVVGGDGDVALVASSQVRITLNKSLNLPIIFGRREGGSIDFLVAWVMARADRFSGPAPGPYARWWVPCYGSLHAALEAPYSYNFAMYWTPDESAVGIQYPEFVEGPFHTAAWASHTEELVYEIVMQGGELYRGNEIWPWVTENYFPGQYFQELFSANNASGRFSFWIRGDTTYLGTPSFLGSGNRYLFSFLHQATNWDGTLLGRVWFHMEPADRYPYLQIGSQVGGTTTVSWPALELPDDGEWHFYSVSWDYLDGSARVMLDGTSVSSNIWDTNGDNSTDNWYQSDADLYENNGKITTYFRSHLPVSDVIMESGPEVHATWTDIWPVYPWPSFTAVTRPTMQTIEAVVDDAPVNGWDTLSELARNTMSWYRADEWDNLQFLPPQFFAEADQQEIAYITDTEVNAQELNIIADPSKSRNVVTVKYVETSADLTYSTCLAVTSSTSIPPGTSEWVFSLDSSIVEIHGASDPYASWWVLTNLTSSQISAGTGGNYDQHYMAVNSKADGSGTVLGANSVTATIRGYTQTTVTLRFVNKTGTTAYLANNYQGDNQLPSLRILGYLVKTTEAWVTERDGGAIGFRRERAMESEMAWVHTRYSAQQMASRLVSRISRPRPEVTVEVFGDPRRTPGQLVTLADATATRAMGRWRVLGMTHNADGPAFTQTLRLMKVDPVAVWDVTTWDHSVWGE